MQKSLKKNLLTGILTVFMLLSFAFAVVFMTPATADGVNVPAEQTYGEVYRLPKLTTEVDGQQVEAETVLYKPDGTSTTTAAITLNQTGVYTLEFLYNGKKVAEDKSFIVRYPYWQFSGKGSTAEYVQGEGLKVSHQTGVRMSFNEIVDISKVTANTLLFQMYVTPSVPGTADFNKFDLIITDIYDEDNSLTIHVENTVENGDTVSYIRAGGPGQPLTGREMWITEKIHANGAYGTPVSFTFNGKPGNESANVLCFYYDYETKCLYRSGSYLIADFDDKKYFSNVWDGFEDGQVRFSIVPSGGTQANYVITDIYGLDLGKSIYTDAEGPALTVDVPTELPVAKAGVAYPVFDAYAYDSYAGEVSVSTKVYYNYYSANPYLIAVKDGKFTPPRAGQYTIEYSAIDHFDNEVKKTIDITCATTVADISVELIEDQETGKVGEWIQFANVNVAGGSGEKTVDVSVEYAGGAEYEVSEDKFKPYKAGEYTIVYTVKDYLGNEKVFKNKINVSANPDPVFEYAFNVPKYLIEGATYVLPEVYATDFNADRKQIKAEIIVSDAAGERTLSDNRYQPQVNASGDTVAITYKAERVGGVVTEPFVVPVYSVGEGESFDSSAYFVSDKAIEKKYTSVGIEFTAKEDTTLHFINAVLFDKFELNFALNASKMTTFKVVLEDKYDVSQKFYIAFNQKNGAVVADINGETSATTDYKFTTAGTDFLITFDSIGGKVKLGTNLYEVNNFPEFTSGSVFVSWEFEGVSGNSAFSLKKLNNQVFTSDAYDITNPQIALMGERGDKLLPGESVASIPALGGDVLDPCVTVTVTVKGPDSQVVTDKNGLKLENVPADKAYEFVCTSYGNYNVSYLATDTSDNSATITYTIKVWDGEAPVISVNTADISVKKGEALTLPTATATDNVSGECAVYACVKTPYNKIVHAGEAEFTFDEKGTYYIYYYSMDKNGNLSTVEVKVNVK